MSFRKASVRDADVAGKPVLVRVDFNVPLEGGRVVDDTRIRAALPTIELLRDRGAKLVLVSHLGRPGGKVDPDLSMAPVAESLGGLLGTEVRMAPEVIGDGARKTVDSLSDGDVALLENSRFEAGETENDPVLAESLAGLAEIFVNDAFGAAHRAHATTEGVTHHLPAYAGLLLERELTELARVTDEPRRPLVVVLGGAKVSDKIGVIERFLEIADEILIGGAMCFTFFAADNIGTGNSLVEKEAIEMAERAIVAASKADCELRFPRDLILGKEFDADTETRVSDGQETPDGWMGLDIGPHTASEYAELVAAAGTVLWNGPMGAFEMEPFAGGTRTVAEAVAATPATTVVGGGDSVAALQQFGLGDQVNWLSTGGGASLELLEGKPLPGVEALRDA